MKRGCAEAQPRGEKPKAYCFSHFLQSQPTMHQMQAARMAPTNGPTMKIHKFCNAVPPWKMAGASERAGFTLVPV